MMGDSKKLSTSDDEEDLETLRLVALQSLKKKNDALNGAQLHNAPHFNADKPIRYNRLKGMQSKRGRFFGAHQGRSGKNVQFNNRVRNTNLISIPTIPSEEEVVKEDKIKDEVTISLPQDRYCGADYKEAKTDGGKSKFSRYDNSDKSETESEEEAEVSSEDDSPGKLERSDSLEALMQELDDEIQGKTKVKEEKQVKEEKPKAKRIKKKKRAVADVTSTPESDAKTEQKVDCDTNVEVIKHNESDNKVDKIVNNTKEQTEGRRKFDDSYSPVTKRPRSRSPINRRGFPNRRRPRNFHKFPPQPLPFAPLPPVYPASIMPFPNPPFNPLFAPPNMLNQPPPFFERPLSPLAIKAESLTTATLAPLSPRSAAFVLENKAIIERRKRSPRRSYSRSSSRSPRRSLTPRRSPRRSISPRRISRSPRRLSRSPRRRSLSPRRRSMSPKRRILGRSTDNSPKNRPPVRQRLGVKSNKTDESKEKVKEEDAGVKKDDKPLDPILEARKRKFESNEIKVKEGIIRLKPKEEKLEEKSTVSAPKDASPGDKHTPVVEEKMKVPDEFEELENLLNEDVLLEGDDIVLDPKVDGIFSDEDSASDNEGRFKVKQQKSNKPPVLSFTKLVNGIRADIKSEALRSSQKSTERRRDRRRNNKSDRSRVRARSPLERKDLTRGNAKEEEKKPASKKPETAEKSLLKSRISLKSDRHVTPIEKRFERKIEIKIKNPSKYERGGKLKLAKNSEEKKPEKVSRKVELGDKDVVQEEDEVEPEIVVENDSGDEENSVVNEGDLRAQLSKKRAEKMCRVPIEGITSRLLQNALQGAVFKKTKKKTKEQDITTSDGKLPIHLRLGTANNSDIFADTKVKRKSRKRKNREVLEQVYYLLLRHYYISQF